MLTFPNHSCLIRLQTAHINMHSRTFPGTEVRQTDGTMIPWILFYAFFLGGDDILQVFRDLVCSPGISGAFCVESLVLIPRCPPLWQRRGALPCKQGTQPFSQTLLCVCAQDAVASQSLFAHPACHAPSSWCSTGPFKSPAGAPGSAPVTSASLALSLCSRQ